MTVKYDVNVKGDTAGVVSQNFRIISLESCVAFRDYLTDPLLHVWVKYQSKQSSEWAARATKSEFEAASRVDLCIALVTCRRLPAGHTA